MILRAVEHGSKTWRAQVQYSTTRAKNTIKGANVDQKGTEIELFH